MVCIQPSLKLAFLSALLYSFVAANKHGRNDLVTAASGNGTSAIRGDRQCPSQSMCVTGILNGSTATYELQSIGSQNPGWMAIGFGKTMTNASMVVMWPNTNGTMTLSQRQSTGHTMPTPVAPPTNIATAAASFSTLNSSQPVLAFTIAGSAQQVPLIWAYGNTRPAAAPNSTLQKHVEAGQITLDLTATLSSSNGTPASISSSGDNPLLPYEKTIVAHAVVATFGFLFLLPGGVLLARYVRTISTQWYTGHWIIQAALGGPVVIVGCALGFVADDQLGGSGSRTHKTIGIVLLSLYLLQCSLGAFIHYVKIPFRFGRPPQNYAHAILGLTTIALAIYQVYLGFHDEWPNATGRTPLGNAVTLTWIIWTVVLALLYFGGLAYLPRQWRKEKANPTPAVQYRVTSSESQEFNKYQFAS